MRPMIKKKKMFLKEILVILLSMESSKALYKEDYDYEEADGDTELLSDEEISFYW